MKTNLFSFSILIALSIIWGTSFVLMKWGMSWNEKPTFSAEEVAGLRIFFASVFLIPLLYKHFKAFNFKKYGLPVFGMGMFGNFIPAFLFTAAETKINSSLAGMLNALTPLFTILISVFIFRVKSSRVQLYGVTLGLDRKSTRLNSSHIPLSRMPSSA